MDIIIAAGGNLLFIRENNIRTTGDCPRKKVFCGTSCALLLEYKTKTLRIDDELNSTPCLVNCAGQILNVKEDLR